jgi:hypothetical protein
MTQPVKNLSELWEKEKTGNKSLEIDKFVKNVKTKDSGSKWEDQVRDVVSKRLTADEITLFRLTKGNANCMELVGFFATKFPDNELEILLNWFQEQGMKEPK